MDTGNDTDEWGPVGYANVTTALIAAAVAFGSSYLMYSNNVKTIQFAPEQRQVQIQQVKAENIELKERLAFYKEKSAFLQMKLAQYEKLPQ